MTSVGEDWRRIVSDDGLPGPSEPVLAQGDSYGPDGMDVGGWLATIFFPLVISYQGGTEVYVSEEIYVRDHLFPLVETAQDNGIFGLHTEITGIEQTGENIATLKSLRSHLGPDRKVLTTVSVTWTVIREAGVWKINQIHFNDHRADRSVVARMNRSKC